MTAPAPGHGHDAAADSATVDWGEYAAAVHRWELITGRPAPYPTQPGRHGRPVLAPQFVEWLMGLPPGWTTAEHLGLPRTAQLRALGNGVLPQQAAYALGLLFDDLARLATNKITSNAHCRDELSSNPMRTRPRPRRHVVTPRSTRPLPPLRHESRSMEVQRTDWSV